MNQNMFRASDLYEVALLHATGFKLRNIIKRGDKVLFMFTDDGHCEEMIKKYVAGDCTINARAFVDSIRTIKSYIFRK